MKPHFTNNTIRRVSPFNASKRQPLPREVRERIDAYIEEAELAASAPPLPLDEYLRSSAGETFHDMLWDFIDRDGRSEVAIYEAAGISRSKFSRIRSDRNYRPDKVTAVSLVFALRLGLDAAESLLRAAGLALSAASRFDLIVRYFLETGDTDPFHVNDALYAYGQPLICGVEE